MDIFKDENFGKQYKALAEAFEELNGGKADIEISLTEDGCYDYSQKDKKFHRNEEKVKIYKNTCAGINSAIEKCKLPSGNSSKETKVVDGGMGRKDEELIIWNLKDVPVKKALEIWHETLENAFDGDEMLVGSVISSLSFRFFCGGFSLSHSDAGQFELYFGMNQQLSKPEKDKIVKALKGSKDLEGVIVFPKRL